MSREFPVRRLSEADRQRESREYLEWLDLLWEQSEMKQWLNELKERSRSRNRIEQETNPLKKAA